MDGALEEGSEGGKERGSEGGRERESLDSWLSTLRCDASLAKMQSACRVSHGEGYARSESVSKTAFRFGATQPASTQRAAGRWKGGAHQTGKRRDSENVQADKLDKGETDENIEADPGRAPPTRRDAETVPLSDATAAATMLRLETSVITRGEELV